LFYKTNEPAYSLYRGIGQTPAQRKHGGQFRDVAAWPAQPMALDNPTTRPLP
jgi:hypothetical protein